ncbi:MAG: inositol monophosphatase [Proteobacteria bacterium]|nr:inositol monophosphatase [Pseudomonadota bacterium]
MHSLTPALDHFELEKLVRKAGDKLLELWPGRAQGRSLKIDRKADGSMVTEADFASHQIITSELRRRFPADFILSEEDIDAPGFAAARSAWILDPLDGTEIFSRGKNYFAIFLSRRVDRVITEGIMYYPALGTYFWASRGQGAFCDSKRLRVSSLSDGLRPNSVFFEGIPSPPSQQGCTEGTYQVSTQAFMGLCRGEIDGAVVRFERGHFYPWDFAPGTLIIEESGGKVSDEDGRPVVMSQAAIPARYLVASNGTVHGQLLNLIAPSVDVRG